MQTAVWMEPGSSNGWLLWVLVPGGCDPVCVCVSVCWVSPPWEDHQTSTEIMRNKIYQKLGNRDQSKRHPDQPDLQLQLQNYSRSLSKIEIFVTMEPGMDTNRCLEIPSRTQKKTIEQGSRNHNEMKTLKVYLVPEPLCSGVMIFTGYLRAQRFYGTKLSF